MTSGEAAPVTFPTWARFAAAIRYSREGGTKTRLATATADHRATYEQLPVTEEHRRLAAATSRGPCSEQMPVCPHGRICFAREPRIYATIRRPE